MQASCALIIFVKNLVPGKVKTRLAATVGNEKALEVYQQLLRHTKEVCQEIHAHRVVYYSEQVEENGLWDDGFAKAVQHGADLGQRMKNAFAEVLEQGFSKAVIIGTDCPGLTAEIVNAAFTMLEEKDVVVGPAFDGGYYLLGMKTLYGDLFETIAWSTSSVCETTLAKCRQSQLRYDVLPTLHDIDEEKDLVHLQPIWL
ncbi:TIGR04282 family arsenosugar biosynthesis glycosyltransferase [Rufibacter hautae]|uniref:Glycosyltransferase n=1 Tax=Rufibacter hautae TaxID=2595005 RepID=A0A5B6TAN0_9BACT|nr:TIGR04282 family arsenosugar biosynthesis glycosyltransferase [Rufibacter hautae]KAA3436927.1 glycosyltransferase [Rufibacter hautae]